jgi:F-type H+-transporting ATPase subunit b
MTRIAIALAAALAAAPAAAAVEGKPFFSLYNTDIVVAIAFLLFIGVLVRYKVPDMIGAMLDKRAEQIRSDLDEARQLREEAQQVLAGYERKLRDVKDQARRIVERAAEEARAAAAQAERDMASQVARRIAAAEEQIAAAEADALRNVRNRAVAVAVAAAAEVIAKQMSADEAGRLIDAGIGEVEARLH